MLVELRQKWDCFWPKRAVYGNSPIYPLAIKFLKKRSDINPTWCFYVATGTSLGTFRFNPKHSNMHILASWDPVVQSM